jgi:predicted ATPase
MFLSENGLSKPIPASRFSDGTLAFLRLIALLYEPSAPMILAIEEPEVGLHPDAIRIFADAVKEGSIGKQILITTHSPELVDAFSDDPEAIVVCEKDPEQGTQFRRLSSKELKAWLELYTLGELWTRGEIGGNRW